MSVTPVFGMCVGGAGAASRSPEGAAQPADRTQKRRARREAALDRLERAGELVEPASRAGRWRMQQREQAALLDRLHTRRLQYSNSVVFLVWQERQATCGATSDDSSERPARACPAPDQVCVHVERESVRVRCVCVRECVRECASVRESAQLHAQLHPLQEPTIEDEPEQGATGARSESMRARRCDAMLRCEARRGEGKRGDARRVGELKRGEGMRGEASEARRAVGGEARRGEGERCDHVYGCTCQCVRVYVYG